MEAKTIDEVIAQLASIIEQAKVDENPAGYFAALYQKVTITVKEKLHTNYFADDARMEKLDVVFANRYLSAYTNYSKGLSTTKAWEVAFTSTNSKSLIVLQHLLLGMNAHINLDLGIAAAQISDKDNIESLQSDFNKINEILSALVDEIQRDLAAIWPTLTKLLRLTKRIDDFIIDFSMQLARDGAWGFAKTLVSAEHETQAQLIQQKDQKVAELTKNIISPGLLVRFFLLIIRLGERGTVSEKIAALQGSAEKITASPK